MSILLSLSFLSLNFLACSDAEEHSEDTTIEIADESSEDHTHDSAELCSPFCQCHCCHVHTINFNVVAFAAIVPEITSDIFVHFDSLGKDIPHTILQPPRV